MSKNVNTLYIRLLKPFLPIKEWQVDRWSNTVCWISLYQLKISSINWLSTAPTSTKRFMPKFRGNHLSELHMKFFSSIITLSGVHSRIFHTQSAIAENGLESIYLTLAHSLSWCCSTVYASICLSFRQTVYIHTFYMTNSFRNDLINSMLSLPSYSFSYI